MLLLTVLSWWPARLQPLKKMKWLMTITTSWPSLFGWRSINWYIVYLSSPMQSIPIPKPAQSVFPISVQFPSRGRLLKVALFGCLFLCNKFHIKVFLSHISMSLFIGDQLHALLQVIVCLFVCLFSHSCRHVWQGCTLPDVCSALNWGLEGKD